MTPLELARADLDAACSDFNAAASTTTPPDMLERAVRRLMASVENWADVKREDGALMNTQLEMIYTPFEQSCRYPHLNDDYTIRLCRRMKGHTDHHASDHPFLQWETSK